MDAPTRLAAFINSNPKFAGKVVDFNASENRLYNFDFTKANKELSEELIANTEEFGRWVNKKLIDNHCLYGIGGYMEHRTIYSRSSLFDTVNEPRRLHLGIDIWGKEGIAVYSPLPGKVHSFNDNNNFGDYGPTIILEHNLDGLTLYSLYGHLSRNSFNGLSIGGIINSKQKIGSFGNINENGHWPPHLHFQLMYNMEGWHGDYPGVCRYSEMNKYRKNILDPQLLLRFPKAINL